jgi:hypothetical protein
MIRRIGYAGAGKSCAITACDTPYRLALGASSSATALWGRNLR